jgi:transposase
LSQHLAKLREEGIVATLFGAGLTISGMADPARVCGFLNFFRIVDPTLDRSCDAASFRKALADRNITACIPSEKARKVQIQHDPVLYCQRHKIENTFGSLKDWRRIHTR